MLFSELKNNKKGKVKTSAPCRVGGERVEAHVFGYFSYEGAYDWVIGDRFKSMSED